MKDMHKRNHIIDSLFPIVLFFVFTVSAVIVILLATKIYESTTERSTLNNVAYTSLTYVSEKVHRNDSLSNISLTDMDGTMALTFLHTGDKEGYTTYIYYHDGFLKELFIKNQVVPSLSMGTSISKVTDFEIKQIESNLFRISCVDESGHTISTIVGLRSSTER